MMDSRMKYPLPLIFVNAVNLFTCLHSSTGTDTSRPYQFKVATSKVICPTLGDTRTEEDFVAPLSAQRIN